MGVKQREYAEDAPAHGDGILGLPGKAAGKTQRASQTYCDNKYAADEPPDGQKEFVSGFFAGVNEVHGHPLLKFGTELASEA